MVVPNYMPTPSYAYQVSRIERGERMFDACIVTLQCQGARNTEAGDRTADIYALSNTLIKNTIN